METTLEGRDRLENVLVRLDRLGRGRRGSARRHVRVPGPDGGGSGGRRSDPGSAPDDPRDSPPSGLTPSMAETVDELVARLDLLEARVSLLGRPVPASREIFAEWVRLRRHEEMSFGDYLRLRRTGLV